MKKLLFFILLVPLITHAGNQIPYSIVNHSLSESVEEKGVLMSLEDDIPIYSNTDGRVSYSGYMKKHGNVIFLDYKQGLRSIFLGDFSTLLKKGDDVKKGQIIGYVTKVSDYKGLSLYFQMRKNSEIIHTKNYIRTKGVKK